MAVKGRVFGVPLFLVWCGACFDPDSNIALAPVDVSGSGAGVAPSGPTTGTGGAEPFPPTGSATSGGATSETTGTMGSTGIPGATDTSTTGDPGSEATTAAAVDTSGVTSNPRPESGFRLGVTLVGSGAGTVVSDPAGGACPGTCSLVSEPGAVVTLTATPDGLSTFEGWSGACTGVGVCSVTMDRATEVTATFGLRQFTLTVTAPDPGLGRIESTDGLDCGNVCTRTYDARTVVNLSARPALGYALSGWSDACTGRGTCRVTIDRDLSVGAGFTRRGFFYAAGEDQVLMTIHPETLEISVIGPLGIDYAFGDCAWDPAEQELYMVDGRPGSFYRVDVQTGQAQLIGNTGTFDTLSLALHPPTGALYVGNPGLSTVARNTGALTSVTTDWPALDGMTWDSTRNEMIGFVANLDDGDILRVDVTAGVATPIARTGGINNLGLAYDPVIDRIWAADSSGSVFVYDPNQDFARATATRSDERFTCLAYVP